MKKVLNRIFIFIKTILRGFNRFYSEYATVIIDFIERVKIIVDSDLTIALVELTPAKFDDKLLAAFKEALAILFPTDLQQDAVLSEETMLHYISCIKNASPEHRKAIYFKIASLMLRKLASGENLSTNEADTVIQLSYGGKKRGQFK